MDNPEPIAISRRVTSTLAMATLQAACLATGTTVAVLFATDFAAAPSVIGALFLGLGIPLMLGANLYVLVYWSRVAARARFDDRVTLRTFRGRRCYAWTELGRLVVFEQGLPIPARCVVKLAFTDGRRYVVFANREQGQELYRLAKRQDTAEAWVGAPLPRATALALIGLGVVAVFLAALIVGGPVADVARGGNRAGGEPVDPLELAAVAVVVPLAGLAGIAAGTYHLVRRPIVVMPGVEYHREGEAARRGEHL